MTCSENFLFQTKKRNYFWCKEPLWEVENNPVGTAFEIFWMFFEPALFGVCYKLYKYAVRGHHIPLHLITVSGIGDWCVC